MMTKLAMWVVFCLTAGAAMAQEAKVTSLMSKELAENPGKDVLMVTVIRQAAWTLSTDTMRRRLSTCWKAPS